MLTSSNDYLRPEYLTPLSTTLDAKKSPLALLAQTCSQIGADTPNCKLLLAKEKSSKSSKESSSSSSSTSSKDKSAQDLSKSQDISREKSLSPETRKKCDVVSRSPSHQSASSSRTTPAEVGSSETRNQSPEKETSGSPQVTVSEPKTVFTPNIITSSSSSDSVVGDMPLGSFKPGDAAFLPTYAAAPGFPIPMDMTPHHMKPGLNPYFSYARLKTQQDSLAGQVCRDPYCTGCGVSSHLLVNSKPGGCAVGCSQCDHAKPGSYLGANAAAAAYAHALHLPYICSWISGDAQYCGKRFANSEELLYHLRTHTSVSSAETDANQATWPMLTPAHGLLHRPYPTSSLPGTRYHPYYKPSLLSSTFGTAFTAYPFTQPPYLSPYSLYTTPPRLGTTPGMLNS